MHKSIMKKQWRTFIFYNLAYTKLILTQYPYFLPNMWTFYNCDDKFWLKLRFCCFVKSEKGIQIQKKYLDPVFIKLKGERFFWIK